MDGFSILTPLAFWNSIILSDDSDFPFFQQTLRNFWQGHKYAQFSLFNAKIFQMTPLALYLSAAGVIMTPEILEWNFC